jgi:hypothetical protein
MFKNRLKTGAVCMTNIPGSQVLPIFLGLEGTFFITSGGSNQCT